MRFLAHLRNYGLACMFLVGFMAQAIAQPTLTVDQVTGSRGQAVSVPISFDPGGAEIAAFNLTITVGNPASFSAFAARTTANADGGATVNCPVFAGPIQVSCSTVGSTLNYVVEQLANAPLPALDFGRLEFTIDNAAPFGVVPLDITVESFASPAATVVPPGTSQSGSVEVVDLAPELSLAPLTLTFTAQQGTTSAAQQVVATNTGDLDGLIFGSFDFGGGGFAQNNNCPTAAPGLAIGASCTINIEFAPPAAGDFSTNFTVVTTNGGTGVVAITATGTLGPQSALSVSGPLDFGSIDLNDLPDTGTITATNTGDAGSSLAISAVNYAGDAAFAITNNGCAGAAGTLAQNQSCAVEVSFNTAAAGNYTGTVSFTSNAATNPTPSASVLGTATATANISVNPPFGPVNLGTGEAGETLTVNGTLTNTGSAAAEVACVLNDASGVFSTAPSPLNATVNANSTVPFALSCALPTAGEQGDAFAATLTCSVDGQEAGVHQLACDITDFVPVPVPTMSSWSIALFALLMLLVGGFSIRMFRIQ